MNYKPIKLKSDSGITLIELIVCISLLTTILFIGYRIYDKVQILPAKQIVNSDIQNGINRLRDFISKELKYCEFVELEYKNESEEILVDIDSIENSNSVAKHNIVIINKINKLDDFSYRYNVVERENKSDKDKSSYIIDTFKKGNHKYFSLSKIDSKGIKLYIIDKQRFDLEKLPVEIKSANEMYNVKINYFNTHNKEYEFDIYNNYMDGNIISPPIHPPIGPPETADGPKNLVKECIIQSYMLIQQIELEVRGSDFHKEIDVCKNIAGNIIDNYDYYWENKDKLREQIDKLNLALDDLEDKVANGNSQNKVDIREYLNKSQYYLDKAIYILNKQDYEKSPNLDRELLIKLSIISGEDDKYVSFKGMINELTQITTNLMFEKLEVYCNYQGRQLIGTVLEPYISTVQAQINTISSNYLQPMYHPSIDTSSIKKENLKNAIDELISNLEYFKSNEINKILEKQGDIYIYINHQDDACVIQLVKNLNQNINIAIEELKYIKFIIGE